MEAGQAPRTMIVELPDRRYLMCETDIDLLERKCRLVEVSEDSESEGSDEEGEEEETEEDVEVEDLDENVDVAIDEVPAEGK